MRPILFAAAISLIATQVGAAEDGGLRVVKMLVTGKAAEVTKLFNREDPSMLSQLKEIVASAGEITGIAQVNKPRFIESRQYKVVAPDLPRSFSSINYRVNASSVRHGPIQFTVAKVPDSDCKILSIQLEVDAKS
jgi:hypothetical protein